MLLQILRNHSFGRKVKPYSNFYTTIIRYYTEESKKRPRVPWDQQEGEWYSWFRLFAPEKGLGPDLIRILQSPFDLRPKSIRKWWKKRMEQKELYNQRFIPKRHEMLGSDLATAHFIVYRGGSVKFHGQTEWVKKNEDDEYDLPSLYVEDLFLEAVDASKTSIQYEGLSNCLGLKRLKWLSFNNCPYFDDWCMDRISGEYHDSLEYLNISNCHNVSERGLSALYRLEKLQTLEVHNIANSNAFKLTCLLLEDIKPNLKIVGVEYTKLDNEKLT